MNRIICLVGLLYPILNCRASHWFKAYQHDRDGVAIFGNKLHLLQAVKSGAELRVLRDDPDCTYYLTALQNISPVPGTDDVCAQATMAIGKADLYTFDNNAHWYFVNLCTTGDWHVSRWIYGDHTLVNETNEHYGMSWFIRHRCSACPIYSTRAYSWKLLHYSYQRLLLSISSGHGFRIVYRSTENECYSFPVDNLAVAEDGSIVGAMGVWHLSQELVTSPDRYEFTSDVFWQFVLVSIRCDRHTSRWEVGDHVQINETFDMVETDWYSDPCWRFVYSHDENGTQVDGSLSALVEALHAGHKIRLLYSGHTSIEANQVILRNGHVCAVLMDHLSKATTTTFVPDVYWFWQIACTTGNTYVSRIKVGSTETVPGTSPVKREISWFVDEYDWEKVLSQDRNGNVVSGSKADLRHAIRQGADVRYRIDLDYLRPGQGYYLFWTADNLELSSSSDDVAAMHLRLPDTNPSGMYESIFTTPVSWAFTITSTFGDMDVAAWRVEGHTLHFHTTLHTAVEWFVNC